MSTRFSQAKIAEKAGEKLFNKLAWRQIYADEFFGCVHTRQCPKSRGFEVQGIWDI
jgi:hypothetical protein